MGVFTRGFKNAFRNPVRTFSIVLILSLSIGLALTMLLSLRAVQTKIDSVKASIGNIITVLPAGARGFEGGGEPLTASDSATIKSQPHISKVSSVLNVRLASTDTSLQAAIDAGTLGGRTGRFFGSRGNFTPPIIAIGTDDPTSLQALGGGSVQLSSGALFNGSADSDVAIVGKDLASKNNLAVGSTFKLFGSDVSVVGIFDGGNRFTNSGLALPLPALQRLASQPGEISQAIVQADSISNLDPTVAELKSALGDRADVVSQQDTSSQALAPLENIKNISFYSLIGSLSAGAVIIFLIMLMIVRERRREIGVLKAIGAPNWKIVTQFVTEALTFTVLGSALGVVLGAVFSQTVTKVLLDSSLGSQNVGTRGIDGAGRFIGQVVSLRTINDLQTLVGSDILLYGLAAAVGIAVIGSAIPAYLTAKIRPAEVLRGE